MAKRVDMFYGESGTGKSENALEIIKLIAEATGKRARVWVGDGSAATYDYSGLVDLGVVEVFSWEARDYPLSTLNFAAKGYKPKDPNDPHSLLIPTPPSEMADIGVMVFEGISVAGKYILGNAKGGFAYRAARGEKIGQDSPIKLKDGEGDNADVFGGNPLSHFMHAQNQLLAVLERSKQLPAEFVIWTGHEVAAENKNTKEIVIGPEAAGKALTTNLQRIFGNTLHHTTAEKRTREKDDFTGKSVDDLDVEWRIYTRDHISPTSFVKYKAVTRGGLTEAEMPTYLTSPVPGAAIREFYERLRNVSITRMETAKTRFEKVVKKGEAA